MLGERTKDFSLTKRLTQEELAELLFVSSGYVPALETGKKTLSLPLLMKSLELPYCSLNLLSIKTRRISAMGAVTIMRGKAPLDFICSLGCQTATIMPRSVTFHKTR